MQDCLPVIPGHVRSAHFEDEAVLLHLRDKSYVSLNSTAAYVWQGLEQGWNRDRLMAGLQHEFGASAEEARTALAELLEDLLGRGFLTPASAG
jgi:hypothetical protein